MFQGLFFIYRTHILYRSLKHTAQAYSEMRNPHHGLGGLRMKNILFCLLAAVLVLSASCDQEIKPVEYKVSFDANGGNGTLPDSLTVVEGGGRLCLQVKASPEQDMNLQDGAKSATETFSAKASSSPGMSCSMRNGMILFRFHIGKITLVRSNPSKSLLCTKGRLSIQFRLVGFQAVL